MRPKPPEAAAGRKRRNPSRPTKEKTPSPDGVLSLLKGLAMISFAILHDMKIVDTPYKKLILVCTNRREDGKCCADGGSEAIRDVLKAKVKAAGLPIRVSKTGCLDRCQTGPTVVVMPDDLWFGEFTLNDVDSLLERVSADLCPPSPS